MFGFFFPLAVLSSLLELPDNQKQAMSQFHAFTNQDVIELASLEGGLTRAKLYRFDHEGQSYVLRFLDPMQPHQFRENEIKALQLANEMDLAPKCSFSDKDSLLMVMPFLSGHTLQTADVKNEKIVKELARKICLLHSYKGEYPTRYTLNERIHCHYKKAKEASVVLPTGFDEAIVHVLSLPDDSFVPSHGDLNPSNIMVDRESISFIDWTTATFDSKYTDLSYLCFLTNMPEEHKKLFLESYFGRAPTSQELKLLVEGKQKIFLLMATIWLRFSESEEEKKIPYEQRIAKLDQQLCSSSLREAEDYIEKGEVVNLKTAPKEAIKAYALSFYKAFLKI